jgi:hypothetical protein
MGGAPTATGGYLPVSPLPTAPGIAMPCLHPLLGSLAILLAGACSQGPAPAPTHPGPQPGAEAPAPNGEPGQDPNAAAKTLPPAEQMRGSWALELTPAQQRQYELLQLAFREMPPTEAELAALEPEEQLMIGMVLTSRAQAPDGQADPALRQGLDELASATLEISEDRMVFSHGEVQDEASYTVIEEKGAHIEIEATTTVEGEAVVEKVHVQLEGAQHLVLWAEGDPPASHQRFVRRPGEGAQAPSPEGQDKQAQGADAPQPERKPPEGSDQGSRQPAAPPPSP